MSIRTSVLAVRSAALVVASAGLATSVLATPTYTTIALTGTSGQYGPGMGTATFTGQAFNAPVVSNSGNVAFRGQVGTNEGMWIFGGGVNNNVALAGSARPGGGIYPAGTGVINSPAVNDSGEWFMRQGASSGAYGTAGGVAYRMALGGDIAPGTGSATFATSAVASGMPLYNQAGQSAFVGTLTTGSGTPPVTITSPNGNASGLWIGTPGAMNLVLRQNDTSTLLDAGQAAGQSRVGSLSTGTLSFNNNGAYVMTVALQGSNIVTGSGVNSNASAVVSNRNGSFEVIARSGAAAPDANGVASSTDLYRSSVASSQIGFNNAGHVAFVSGLRNAAGTQTAFQALFTDTNGTLHQAARSATAVGTVYNPDGTVDTGFAAGTNWSSFTNPVINAQNLIAFTASTNAATGFNAVMTMDTTGRLTSIVQQGEVAIVGGNPLGGDATFSSPNNVQLNALGQMVFTSTLTNTPDGGIFGGPGGNNSAFFGWDPTAGLQLIARNGDQFQVAPGDVRTISGFNPGSATGNQDGHAVGLNNSGQVAFTLYFSDGSAGVYLATIPTPGAAGLLGMAGLLASRRRR